VGVSQNNFLGLGQALSLNAGLSTKTMRFNLNFVEPHLLDSDFTFATNGYNERLNYKDYQGFNEDRRGGTFTFGRRLLPRLSASLGYRLEQVHIRDVDPSAPPEVQQALNTNNGYSVTSSTTLSLVWDGRDNPRDPTLGVRLTGSGTYAGGFLGFDNNFYKLLADAEYYHPLWWRLVLRLHGNITYGNGFGSTPLLPIQERFFLGGVSSIRGFRNFTISPISPVTGGLEGGNKAYFTNTEVIFPIPYLEQFNVKGIWFLDAGNAWAEGQDFSFNLRYGVGPGLRLNTPLGVLSVFAGHNISPKQGEKKNVFGFTVGSSF